MPKITNHDLHIILVGIEKDIKVICKQVDAAEKWQKEHEEKDEARFASLNKYAASIAIVASAVGAVFASLWEKITGQA